MPRSEMKAVLIRHTLSPEEVVALGARLCYSKARVDDLLDKVEAKDQTEFVQKSCPWVMIPCWSMPPSPSASRV